jgi:hypothetical protein
MSIIFSLWKYFCCLRVFLVSFVVCYIGVNFAILLGLMSYFPESIGNVLLNFLSILPAIVLGIETQYKFDRSITSGKVTIHPIFVIIYASWIISAVFTILVVSNYFFVSNVIVDFVPIITQFLGIFAIIDLLAILTFFIVKFVWRSGK